MSILFKPISNVFDFPNLIEKENHEDDPVFELKHGSCHHERGYILDKIDGVDFVKCKSCKEKLNPMYVLHKLCNAEHRMISFYKQYQSDMKKLNEKQRTKCNFCGKITVINR